MVRIKLNHVSIRGHRCQPIHFQDNRRMAVRRHGCSDWDRFTSSSKYSKYVANDLTILELQKKRTGSTQWQVVRWLLGAPDHYQQYIDYAEYTSICLPRKRISTTCISTWWEMAKHRTAILAQCASLTRIWVIGPQLIKAISNFTIQIAVTGYGMEFDILFYLSFANPIITS